jgi:lysophospholipid acyltransferase (LPLAT)-like uncharacterized protein
MSITTRLRRRIANSERLNAMVSGAIAAYLRRAFRKGTWDQRGLEHIESALAEHGAVIMLVWHQRISMAPFMFNAERHQILSLSSDARAGRMAGDILRHFNFTPVKFNSKTSNLAASRTVARKVRDGFSIGATGDGPRGPARVMKTAPLEWARLTQKPIILATYGVQSGRYLNTWDRMILPRLRTRGLIVVEPWQQSVPRKLDADQMEALRIQLEQDLDALTEAVDKEVQATA